MLPQRPAEPQPPLRNFDHDIFQRAREVDRSEPSEKQRVETGSYAALSAALSAHMSASKAKSTLDEALHQAGLSSFPVSPLEAESFVRGALATLLTVRVGPALVEHWLPGLLQSLARGARPNDKAPIEPTIDPWLGRTLAGRFRLLQRVADGRRGALYRAERAGDGLRLAVKLVGPAVYQSQQRFVERFAQECELAKSLSHPHTVTLYEHGAADDHLRFVAMEWLSGIDLARMIASRGPLNVRQAMFLAHQVCESLAYAHSKDVVHGDLSPEGIFVARQGAAQSVVKVLDYGRLRMASFNDEGHSQVGLPQGWARYLAPEQITGDEFDGRADVYAVGAVLYEALSGERPFADSTGIQILLSQVHDRPPTLRSRAAAREVPVEVEQLVMRCLEKDPGARFQSMTELVEITARLAR